MEQAFETARAATLAKNSPAIARGSANTNYGYGSFIVKERQQLVLELPVRIAPTGRRKDADHRQGCSGTIREIGVR